MTISQDHTLISARELFNIESDLNVPVFKDISDHVPEKDENYYFDKETTLAILAGFIHNKHVLLQGYHGTGKSTHIEQVAARLNWPLVRVNLDGHISRIDLIGRDAITLKDGLQVTEFQEGILPWAVQRPCALLFDEYDAARPDVMFVLQRVLEVRGKLTLLDQNKVITPHSEFRIFATSNTVGLGDATGMYHGTNLINQGQMDRWPIVAQLNYVDAAHEEKIVASYAPTLDKALIKCLVSMAQLIRQAFTHGDVSNVMSPRAVINWAENITLFDNNTQLAFKYAYMNKCDASEHIILSEFYQRVFNETLEYNTPQAA